MMLLVGEEFPVTLLSEQNKIIFKLVISSLSASFFYFTYDFYNEYNM